MMFTVTSAIFSEAVLSFFGPAGCITALCAAFYLVGCGLDEIVNPRLRER